jgi:hypothetical protein
MLSVDALRRLLDRQPFAVDSDDLALPGVNAGMFRCVEHRIECLIDCCPSGASIHSRKPSMKGLSSKGCFARRLPIG